MGGAQGENSQRWKKIGKKDYDNDEVYVIVILQMYGFIHPRIFLVISRPRGRRVAEKGLLTGERPAP